ncbi:MAG: EAL domain-containing protein [Burkholderiales bacterium]|nr:EAL domain-containing protein [Burkholderiales bacterium]
MKHLRALIVEDSPSDAELLCINLREQGYDLDARIVSTEHDFSAALDNNPEIIFADYRLPAFNGLRALQILRGRGLDTPFILVSGTIGDELAVAVMQAGADDFVPKDKLFRLDIALKRTLEIVKTRKNLQHAQAEAGRLAAIVESSNDAIISRTLDGIITSWNPAAEKLYGYTAAEAIGQPVSLILPPGVRAKTALNNEQLVRNFHVPPFETQRITKDGRLLDVSNSLSPILDAHGQIVGASQITRDITELKRIRNELIRKSTLALLMETLARTANEAPTPEAALQTCLDTICAHGGWRIGHVVTFRQSDPARAVVAHFWNIPETDRALFADFISKTLTYDYSQTTGALVGKILKQQKPIWVEDIHNFPYRGRFLSLQQQGICSGYGFPVVVRGEVLALLEFFSDEQRQTDALLLENMGNISSQLARLIERDRSNKTIQAGAARLRAILENQSECVKVVGADGSPIEINRAGLEMFEATSITQVRDHGLINFVLPEQRARYSQHFNQALIGETSTLEFEMVGLQGTHRWLESHATRMLMPESGAAAMLSVTRDFTERKKNQEQIAYLSQYDALTRLPNRNLFRDRLGLAIARGKRRGEMTGIMVCNIDRFKQVNDGLGLEAGDDLLRQVAERLKNTLRDVDTIARLGGDEFAILVESVPGKNDVTAIADKLIEAFARPFTVAESEIVIAASIGFSTHPNDTDDMDKLLEHAEMAMEQVKHEGGGVYRAYENESITPRSQRLSLEIRLRHALERNEFQLYYQPKLRLQDGAITGAEALLRWNSPDLGAVSPAHFIPVAEESGLIVPIGEWVLRTACAQMQAWHAQGHAIKVAVNLSPRQFRQKNLVKVVASVLQATGLAPGALELEITEGTAMANAEQAIKVLGEIHALGVKLAVDDFGTGYSSLAYLKRFPLDTLKIDRSFVIDVGNDPNSEAIMCATIALAHSLKLKVVAEGVETAAQRDFLTAAGCNEMQGYLCSPALPTAEFSALLQKQR